MNPASLEHVRTKWSPEVSLVLSFSMKLHFLFEKSRKLYALKNKLTKPEKWQLGGKIKVLGNTVYTSLKPGIIRIARNSKLRVQNQDILRGSVLPEELVNCGEILYGLV